MAPTGIRWTRAALLVVVGGTIVWTLVGSSGGSSVAVAAPLLRSTTVDAGAGVAAPPHGVAAPPLAPLPAAASAQLSLAASEVPLDCSVDHPVGGCRRLPWSDGPTACVPPEHDNDGIFVFHSWVDGYWKGRPASQWMADVGANTGLTALLPALLGHEVVAFEPTPVNVGYLRWSVCDGGPARYGGRLHVVQAAVGAEVGRTSFFTFDKYADNGSLGKSAAVANLREEAIEISVPVISLDAWWDANPAFEPSKCGLLKVDVQGFETLVVRGARRFLAAARGGPIGVLIERDPVMTSKAGFDVTDWDGEMRALGYTTDNPQADDVMWTSAPTAP